MKLRKIENNYSIFRSVNLKKAMKSDKIHNSCIKNSFISNLSSLEVALPKNELLLFHLVHDPTLCGNGGHGDSHLHVVVGGLATSMWSVPGVVSGVVSGVDGGFWVSGIDWALISGDLFGGLRATDQKVLAFKLFWVLF